PCEGLDQTSDAVPGRHEERVPSAGGGRSARLRAESEDDAPVVDLELPETRHGGGERQPLRVGGVDAADERLGHAFERLAPEPASRLEEDDLGSAALDQAVSRRQPGDPAADDRDPPHRAVSRTSAASRRMKSGWSFTALARAKPRPAAPAVARAATSRS